MQFLKANGKKLVAFALSLMLLVGVIPMGMAFAAAEKVVVDAAGTLTDGATDTDGKIIKEFTTIRAAIDYLGAAGGTIYINGTYATTDHESISGTNKRTSNCGPITITGYNGQADKLDLSGSYYHIVQGGELKLENITFGTPSDDTSLLNSNYLYKGFWAYDKFIFGENVVMSGAGLRLGVDMVMPVSTIRWKSILVPIIMYIPQVFLGKLRVQLITVHITISMAAL